MVKRKSNSTESFEAVYRRLEEIVLANSGENEFEEIFKIVLIKLWLDIRKRDFISTLDEANHLLMEIDSEWTGVLTENKLNILEEQFSACFDIVSRYSFAEDGYAGIDGVFEYLVSREKK